MGYTRKFLSLDGLLKTVRQSFQREEFGDVSQMTYSTVDCLMSGLAIYGLKFSSLLQFNRSIKEESCINCNIRNLYGVKTVPSDTQMRERLDRIAAKQIRRAYKQIFTHCQRGKVLEQYRYIDGYYITSIDGTGQYSSTRVHCENCCEKKNKKSGEVTYYHQMLGAVLVHPDQKFVIPFAPEPIVKGDGANKNDCERNASKRLLKDLRREHPHLKLLIVEDGLASNHPHLSLLDSLDMAYVIGVKPGDHKYLFDWINALDGTTYCRTDEKDIRHEFTYYHDIPLNDANHDYRVNVIEYREIKPNGKQQKFSWVTRIDINNDNIYQLMRAGRSRWKIENETFNTLKNQGYNFEHNYGHGYQNLCSVLTMLMMLMFLIEQVQQLCCKTYQGARKRVGKFSVLYEKIRTLCEYAAWNNYTQLLDFIGNYKERSPPESANWMTVIDEE